MRRLTSEQKKAHCEREKRRYYANRKKFKLLRRFQYYGIKPEEYLNLIQKQNNLCAICGKPESALSSTNKEIKSLSVDHCHKTNKIRGLLCHACNTGLGSFCDDINLLQSAIAYLQQHTNTV